MKTLKWLTVAFFSIAIVANVTSIPFLYTEDGGIIEDLLRIIGTLCLIGGLVCAVMYLRALSLPANDTVFYKMHGIGNDYIYFDCMAHELAAPEAVSIALSDRHKGVGGDGIVMICASDVADAKMRMFNADGSEGKMCGNAIRCVGKFLYDFGKVNKTVVTVETLSGIKTLQLTVGADDKVETVRVDMGAPILNPADIPVRI